MLWIHLTQGSGIVMRYANKHSHIKISACAKNMHMHAQLSTIRVRLLVDWITFPRGTSNLLEQSHYMLECMCIQIEAHTHPYKHPHTLNNMQASHNILFSPFDPITHFWLKQNIMDQMSFLPKHCQRQRMRPVINDHGWLLLLTRFH